MVSYNNRARPLTAVEKLMFRIAGIALIILALSAGMATAQTETRYVDISFSLISPITLHEPVAVDVAIKNLASFPISIDLGPLDKWFFHFLTITPAGKQVDITNEGHPIDGFWHSIYLIPNQTHTQRLLLDELYSFDEPGNYSMAASAKVPVTAGKVDKPYPIEKDKWLQVAIAETRLNLVILPRDETALRIRCEALSKRLQEAHGYAEILPIAQQLSYVRDPIAIPYISQLIDKQEEWSALQGLRRINTEKAWEAMIPITKSRHDASTAAYAKKILREKLPDILDPRIRKRIADAIQ